MAEAQQHISSHEFSEWIAFYGLEPWGFLPDNWRAALITSMVANTVRDPKKRPKPYTPDDFMPKQEVAPKASEWSDIKAKSMSTFAALGGKVKE